jgi:dienelactone hydrolase
VAGADRPAAVVAAAGVAAGEASATFFTAGASQPARITNEGIMNSTVRLGGALALLFAFSLSVAAVDTPAPKLKDEMRQPWERNDIRYIRGWKVAGAFKCDLARDCLDIAGGEAAAKPDESQKRADGAALTWRQDNAWNDAVGFAAAEGERAGAVAYAATTVERAAAGKALLSIGSVDGIRVWVNGRLVLSRDGRRSLTPDEDQVEVDLAKGANTLLIKAGATASLQVRVLEPGTVLRRSAEIGPSIIEMHPEMFTVRTDVNASRASAEPVTVEVVKAGGDIAFTASAKRGALVVVDAKGWPEGPYEVRARTKNANGLLYVTYLPWFKGDSLAMARSLAADAAKANDAEPAGFTLKMLAEMVDDRLGVKLTEAAADSLGNPWPRIHSPLMEYAEIQLEARGKTDARVRAGGFMRIAYRDEVDGTPQYARAYLPTGYDPAKKWPLVLQLHGYNPANPQYVRWWSADLRHPNIDAEFAGGEQVIYVEPHGRGNTQYYGLGDNDVLRVLAESRKLFNVDDDRVYLTGESMGGWGTWNVGTRHPDVFAAIAPVFGGVDYHSQMSEEQLAALSPVDRFLQERSSSWALAEGLNNMPIYIHHGDADGAVNVEWSRWGVKLLQRWGYDVRYREYPGRVHETLQTGTSNPNASIPWFLEHRRNAAPRQVRIRTAELRHARSFWVNVQQSASGLGFVNVDAEIIDRNVIRLDTTNVLQVSLIPAALVDASQPITVVWNGKAQQQRLQDGALHLADPAYKPAGLVKTPALPGGINDFTATPFAVVIGTTSKDPAMARMLREKAQGFIQVWKGWQKFEPRVFEDSKITAADIAKYSLLLFGGPAENRVSAQLAGALPLRISRDAITVDGHAFKAPDAAIQMLRPNPRNAQRYLWIVAANSATGLLGMDVTPYQLPEWDYVIVDGHKPAFKQAATRTQTALVSGFFDANWRYSAAHIAAGDAAVRAQANRVRSLAPGAAPDAAALDRYAGRYKLPNGNIVEFIREGEKFFALTGGDKAELLPQGGNNFYLAGFGAWLSFQADAAGKVTGLQGTDGGDFEAPRIE